MNFAGPTAHFGTVQAAYWSGFCMVVVFASSFLLGAGLTNTQIGLVVSVAGILSAAAQPLVAARADISGLSLRWWILTGVLAVATLGGLLLLPLGALLAGVVLGFGILLVQLVQPLINALGMAAMERGIALNFGVARAAGSLAFAFLSTGAGRWVATSGTGVIPVLIIGTQVVCAAAIVTFTGVDRRPSPVHEEAVVAAKPLPMTPMRWRRFVVLLAALTMMMTSHNAINTYMLQIVTPVGGGPAEMGVAVMIGAMVELPPMLGWVFIARRWDAGLVLRLAGLCFVLKSAATWVATDIVGIYLAQSLQIGAFAIMVLGTVYYVNSLLPAAERTRGQGFMTMTASAGSVLGALIGGALLDWFGVSALLGFATLAAAVGAILTWCGVERLSRPQ